MKVLIFIAGTAVAVGLLALKFDVRIGKLRIIKWAHAVAVRWGK